MKCPFCGADETAVADTRINDDGDIVRRRRRCLKCDKRFTTYERAELRLPQIIKKNGSRVDFDRDKLAASLLLALRKRPVSSAMVEAAIARIEEKLLALGEHSAAAARNFGEGAQHFKNIAALIEALRLLLDPNTTVLIKGSRFMKMERVADAVESKSH